MQDRDLDLHGAPGPVPAHAVRPDGEPRGGVVVFMEAFGLNEHIRDVTRRFAREGYAAVAPDLYHRADAADRTVAYDDIEQAISFMSSVDDKGILQDTDAALGYLRDELGLADTGIGIVGFCMGGRATFLVAANRALGAAVGFYGAGIGQSRRPGREPLISAAPDLQTPWLGLFGDQDPAIPVEEVREIEAALDQAPVETDVELYAGAGHGFHCDDRDAYHPQAAADGWRRTLDWFARHLD